MLKFKNIRIVIKEQILIKGGNMINLIGCITVLVLGLLLSNVESIGEREVKIITILGWLIALSSAKGGM